MAFAAARAAVVARKKRAAILARTKALNQQELDKSDRRGLLDSLREVDSTVYLSEIAAAEEGMLYFCRSTPQYTRALSFIIKHRCFPPFA